MILANNFFVITGGPCSGKTTLVHALQKQGFAGVSEVARSILAEEEKIGVNLVTYKSTPEFTVTEFQQSLENYLQAQKEHPDEIVFFDRGIIDVIAYARFRDVPVSDYMHHAALTYRYNNTVFITPPWKAIYCTDTERSESYEESVRIFHTLVAVYQEYGYSLVDLPHDTVQNRVAFVVERVHINFS